MFNYQAYIAYDGYSYFGFQKQGNLETIELALAKAFLVFGLKPKINASGRTDKGVHALKQSISFTLPNDIEPFKVKQFLNRALPNAIRVLIVNRVSANFHARYSVIEKEYFYRFAKQELTPFNNRYAFYLKNCDFALLKKAAMLFIGEHDFRAFTKLDLKKNTIRTITDISFVEDNHYFEIHFKANGFLKYQVRKMVGLLMKITTHKVDISFLTLLLNDKEVSCPYIASPYGLYLADVKYLEV